MFQEHRITLPRGAPAVIKRLVLKRPFTQTAAIMGVQDFGGTARVIDQLRRSTRSKPLERCFLCQRQPPTKIVRLHALEKPNASDIRATGPGKFAERLDETSDLAAVGDRGPVQRACEVCRRCEGCLGGFHPAAKPCRELLHDPAIVIPSLNVT